MAISRNLAIRGLKVSPGKGLRVISELEYCINKLYELYWRIGIEAIVGQTIS